MSQIKKGASITWPGFPTFAIMYIPPHYRNQNQDELLAFIRSHPFAIVVSNGETVPMATHLPFVAEEKDGKIFLTSHFSAANPQANALKNGSGLLVIFSGPNAYISPSLYEKKENVPTWNYIAVHCSGKVIFDQSEETKKKALESMIGFFEPEYQQQWESLRPGYINGLMKGIVAFSVEVTNLEGKFKLSQNKTAAEQKNIADSLTDEELKTQMNKNL